MRKIQLCAVALAVLAISTSAFAQLPEPSEEHQLLKKDVGTWSAVVKMWMGADGAVDPKAEPSESAGEEVNRMLGEFWCVGTFKGEIAGFEFEGRAVNGYDAKRKKYVGSWVDSISPNAMHMSGTYDARTKTLTSDSTSIGPDGNEVKGASTLVYEDDDHRTLTMYEIHDGKKLKSMEIKYTRKK